MEDKTFIVRGEWLDNINTLPMELQDKIIAEVVRYGTRRELQYETDPVVFSMVNMLKGRIDASINAYEEKVEKSKGAGRKKKYDNYKEVDKKTVIKLLKRFNVEVNEDNIEIKNRIIFINGVTLSFNQISYLTDYLKTQIITQKKEEYYWNTSINNSSILKI